MENKNTVKCNYCGREFIHRMPHKCKGGFRKRKIEWIEISCERINKGLKEEKQGFTLHSKIFNENIISSIRENQISNIRIEKTQSGLRIFNNNLNEEMNIQYNHVPDFIMGVLEAYCDFTKHGKINISVKVDVE